MAKAQFHKNQKVWVESVGAWATIEKIVPIWAKGFDEPVRVSYDVGLGREFAAHELKPEDRVDGGADALDPHLLVPLEDGLGHARVLTEFGSAIRT